MHDGPAQSAESVCVEVMRRMIVLTIPEDEVAVLVARRVVQALPPAPSRRPSPDEQFVDPPRGLPFARGLAGECHFSRSATPTTRTAILCWERPGERQYV